MLDLMFKSYDFNNSNPLSNDDGHIHVVLDILRIIIQRQSTMR